MASTPLYTQPGFDQRITKLSSPVGNSGVTKLQRGYMVWDVSQSYPPGYSKGNGPAFVYFLYNPSSIQASYQIQTSGANAAQMFPLSADSAQVHVPLSQQVAFTILFDRTFELWGTVGRAKNSEVEKIGVDVDVRALRQFCGMYVGVKAGAIPGGAAAAGIGTATGTAGGLSQGLMGMVLGYVFFAAKGQGLSYYGYCDSWEVTYTHFTQEMIPMRCSVSVSFTLLPPPVQQSSANGNINTTSTSASSGGIFPTPTGNAPAPLLPSATGVSGR